MKYDIIGDIHGHAESLKNLLNELGYRLTGGVYRHKNRKIIFLGDFIDRGSYQREVIEIVRPMIERGTALAVMGNHEFNAIAYATPKLNGGYLRGHKGGKNRKQHAAFLDAYPEGSPEYIDQITWFKTLPLWLDLGGIRVIHACWDQLAIERIKQSQSGSNLLLDETLTKACEKGSWQYEAIETILKGKEISLPKGINFRDKEGNERHHIRVRWWDQLARTYREAFMGPKSARTHIPNDPIKGYHLVEYSHESPPVFLGHYWLEGEPERLATNIACLDYSVAKPGGSLVAYRWDGETTLTQDKFVAVKRQEVG